MGMKFAQLKGGILGRDRITEVLHFQNDVYNFISMKSLRVR